MSSQGAIRRMINTASLLLLAMVISPMASLSFVPTVSIIRPRTAECSSLFMSSEAVTSSSVRSRRGFINNAIGVSFAVMTGISNLSPSFADGDDINQLTDVYFGVGCFWHIQHEFVEAERRLLNRSDKELTSLTGYAGGKSLGDRGNVCYHNLQFIADYGRLGHGEVVGMKIPISSIGNFAKEYFSLYSPTNERVDPGDVGPEYRSLIGFPGGIHNPAFQLVEEAATSRGLKLVEGRGNDPDTLGKKIVYVMDSEKFPFYQAEVYHQYHDDFQSPPYGRKYNSLAKLAFEDGRVKETGCPDRLPM